MRRLASGVTVLTVHSAERQPVGMTATAFCSVSLEPLLVLACVHSESKTYNRLVRSGYFGVNLLTESASSVADYCARPSPYKVLPAEWLVDEPRWSAPAIVHSLAFLDCEMYRHFPAGTHRVIIGRVRNIGLSDDASARPLLHYEGAYHYVAPTLDDLAIGTAVSQRGCLPLTSELQRMPQAPHHDSLATRAQDS